MITNSSQFIAVHVDGLATLKRVLVGLPAKLQKNVLRGALRAGATVIAREARARVPVKAGQLKASIRVTVRTAPGEVRASIKAGHRYKVFRGGRPTKQPYRTKTAGGGIQYHAPFYAHFVEFGTKPHVIKGRHGKRLAFISTAVSMPIVRRTVRHPGAKPRPFMGPAAMAKQTEAIDAMANYAAERINKMDKGGRP
jgi:HK97 gp10 family phage protein